MNKLASFFCMGLILAGLTQATIVMAEDESDTVLTDDLQVVEKNRRSEIYANPDVDWSVYTEIQLQDAEVSFRRNWQRDQNRTDPFKVNAKDMEKIRNSLSAQFRNIFTEELTEGRGYTMATTTGEQVMTIKPAIVDLDVAAPDTNNASFTKQYTDSAGRMTIKLEIYDSVTGELLATASQRLEDPQRGYMQWTTSVSNRADAERLLRQWAKVLTEKLDEARLGHTRTSAG